MATLKWVNSPLLQLGGKWWCMQVSCGYFDSSKKIWMEDGHIESDTHVTKEWEKYMAPMQEQAVAVQKFIDANIFLFPKGRLDQHWGDEGRAESFVKTTTGRYTVEMSFLLVPRNQKESLLVQNNNYCSNLYHLLLEGLEDLECLVLQELQELQELQVLQVLQEFLELLEYLCLLLILGLLSILVNYLLYHLYHPYS